MTHFKSKAQTAHHYPMGPKRRILKINLLFFNNTLLVEGPNGAFHKVLYNNVYFSVKEFNRWIGGLLIHNGFNARVLLRPLPGPTGP